MVDVLYFLHILSVFTILLTFTCYSKIDYRNIMLHSVSYHFVISSYYELHDWLTLQLPMPIIWAIKEEALAVLQDVAKG